MNDSTSIKSPQNPLLFGGLRIIIAGGGTGGHIFPALAIAHAIKKLAPQTQILFVGAKGKMEMEKVPQAGFDIKGLDIAGFNRSSILKNISLPFKLVKSFFQVAGIIKAFKPTAVIGVGGYSSFPVLRYAQSKGLPTFIHESNSFAGKSNMLLGKKAYKVFTAAEGMGAFFDEDKIVITGNPVRQTILQSTVSKEEALAFFGLSGNKKVLLCIGGSLGAKSINDAVYKDIDLLAKNNLQLIWQTGKGFKEKAMDRVNGRPDIFVSDFISRMEYAYAAADIVVSRSGAMAVAELCVIKKPVLFVPYPFAAENHQAVNAKKIVDKQAAKMINDSEAMQKMIPTVVAISSDEPLQQQLIQNIGKLAVIDADIKIAKVILESLGCEI